MLFEVVSNFIFFLEIVILKASQIVFSQICICRSIINSYCGWKDVRVSPFDMIDIGKNCERTPEQNIEDNNVINEG